MTKNGYQHMVLDHYVERLRQIHRERDERLAAVQSREDALAYQRAARQAILEAFGPWPERTPLRPEVTGVLQRPAHQVEKVTFESRPGCIVTANLYIPRRLTGPAPCVLGACGHEKGKDYIMWQAFAQRLAHVGFVVLIYDPINQGERDQYHHLAEREAVRSSVLAHNMMGKQMELLGDFFGMWRAWDGMRALDYLLSRPEVDSGRVGVTGNSGGGTITTWLWALDQRFTMAAPSCFITTFLHDLENEEPIDAEQYPPGILGDGFEMADFLIAAAPKPILLLGQKYDYFDPRGLKQAHGELERFYQALGAPSEDAALYIGPQGHGYSVHLQRAMVQFFCRHAGKTYEDLPETETLPEQSLWATATGNVIAAGGTPVHEITAVRARQMEAERAKFQGETLVHRLRLRLGLGEARSLPHYRIPRPLRQDDRVFARFAVETEGDVRAVLWKELIHPERNRTLEVENEARLYLPHLSSEVEMLDGRAGGLTGGPPRYSLDVRGVGESLPEEHTGDFFQAYGMDYTFHAHGLMLGQSYLGRRVYDALSAIDLLIANGAEVVHLSGRGQGAILALFASLFHDRIASVTVANAPCSFVEWTQTPIVRWPAANVVRGLLEVCDLPDIRELIGSRLRELEPWGPDMTALPAIAVRST